jgi:peptidoglycan/xylan/chitin deacetylase (PgdA/CDA1 family)
MIALKRALLSAMAAPGAKTALQPLRRGVGCIFMLHRFQDPATGNTGHDPAELRSTLAFLRRRGYELVDLAEMFRRLEEPGTRRDLGVAFTLDDGYADQVRIAGPVFAEYDCPATVFVTSGFLDRKLWFWWDRIEYVFGQTRTQGGHAVIGGEEVTYRWRNLDELVRARNDFTLRCKRVTDEEKHAAIQRLANAVEVVLPEQAPARYEPMTWSELRSWEERGMRFGPHTLTHPILARTSDEQSRNELTGSWERLKSEARHPTAVFCYPNGQVGDFGPREMQILAGLKFQGAVVGTPGYATASALQAHADARFTVRRFNYPDDYRVASQYVTGIERLRQQGGNGA